MDKTLRESQLDPFSLLFMARHKDGHTCHRLHAVYGWIGEQWHVNTWLCFHVKFGWWVGDGCLGSCGHVRAAVLVVAVRPAWPRLPHAWLVLGMRLAAVRLHDLPWEELMGWTAQQDVMVLPDHVPGARDWSRNVFPMVLFRVLAPNCKSYGYEVLSDIQFCRVPPTALHHLLTQSQRGSSLRPTCLTQVTAIALPRNKAETNASSVPSLWAMAASHTARISAEVDMFWES